MLSQLIMHQLFLNVNGVVNYASNASECQWCVYQLGNLTTQDHQL